MSEWAAECQAANRIAARLRGCEPLPTVIRPGSRPGGARAVRAPATGIAGKGAYLKVVKQALMPDVLAFCHEFYEQNDQLPPQACVAARFGVREQTAQDYMRELAAAGHLERNAVGKWRFSRVQIAAGSGAQTGS